MVDYLEFSSLAKELRRPVADPEFVQWGGGEGGTTGMHKVFLTTLTNSMEPRP